MAEETTEILQLPVWQEVGKWHDPGSRAGVRTAALGAALLLHVTLLSLLVSTRQHAEEERSDVQPVILISEAPSTPLAPPVEEPTAPAPPQPRLMPPAAQKKAKTTRSVAADAANPLPPQPMMPPAAPVGSTSPESLALAARTTVPAAPATHPVGENEPPPATTAMAEGTVPASAEGSTADASPSYADNPAPPYPPLARRRGQTGTVEVEVLVSPHGRAEDIRLAHASGHTLLDRAALETVRHWRFVPGRRGNETVAMWVRIPIRFALAN
ncbi:MAG: energy transducer TonB [Thermodesulfobacteriota bacterium]